MSIEIRPVVAADHEAWLPLWQGYQRFYMTEIPAETGAVNLGQGFPDSPGPAEVLDVARAAIGTGLDQYPPGPGIPELRAAVSEHQQRFSGLAYDPATEEFVIHTPFKAAWKDMGGQFTGRTRRVRAAFFALGTSSTGSVTYSVFPLASRTVARMA